MRGPVDIDIGCTGTINNIAESRLRNRTRGDINLSTFDVGNAWPSVQ